MTVLTGGDPEAAREGQPEVLAGLKTTLPGGGLQCPVRLFKALNRRFEANSFDKIGRRRPGFPLEDAGKIAQALGRVPCQHFIAEVALVVVAYPLDSRGQGAFFLELRQQTRAELGLTPGPLGKRQFNPIFTS